MSEGPAIESAGQHHFPLATGTGDFAEEFERYFGPPVTEARPDPYDKVAHTNYTLEERFKGRSLFIGETIDGLITRGDRWYTTLALPWSETDQHHIQWNTWDFNKTLAGRVPHEGISRLVTSSKRTQRAHVVRRGLAFVMEGDDFSTPEGMEQYRRNVLGIAQSVQETQDHDTVFELLHSKNYERHWQQLYGRMGYSFIKLLEDEISHYAAVMKDANLLEIVVERHKQVLSDLGVIPDLLIIPPTASIYMTMVPPQKTQYWTAGPKGLATLEQGPDAMKTFRGVNVFEARRFSVYAEEPHVQLLTRPRQVSEYYTMLAKDYRSGSLEGYDTSWRDTYVYSENKDNYVKITFIEAFKQLRLFTSDGDYHPVLKRLVQQYRDEGREPPRMVAGMPSDDDNGNGNDNNNNNNDAFFLAAPDNNNLYFLINYFGQMDLSKASAKDFEQAGRTMLEQIFPGAENQSAGIEAWNDMIRLIHDIEAQGYDHDYFAALVRANEARNINQHGEFIGESTPVDLVEGWGMQGSLREWAPNSMGSLVLPRDGLENVQFPAGFANGPGFKTLAMEASNPVSPFREIGKRAGAAVNLVTRYLDELRRMLPTSEAMDEKNRSPWFHRADAFTVFFETLVSTQRDPIWMAALPAVTDPVTGGVRGATSGGARARRGEQEIGWFPVPLFVVSSRDLAGRTKDNLRAVLQDLYGGTLPADIQQALEHTGDLAKEAEVGERVFVYESPVTGQRVQIPERFLYRGAMVPREVRALMLMGERSLGDLREIFRVINSDDSYAPGLSPADLAATQRENRNALLRFIEAYSQNRGKTKQDLRRIVRAIALDKGDPQTMLQTIRTIHIRQGDDTATKQRAFAKLRELDTVLAAEAKDPDLEIAAGLQPLQPRAFTQTGPQQALAARASLSFRDIKESMDNIFDLVADVNALRRAVEPGRNLGQFSLRPEGFATWLALDLGDVTNLPGTTQADFTARYGELTAELRRLVADVQVKLQNAVPGEEDQQAWDEEAQRRASGRARFSVQDDETAALRSRFYRAPLTMSLALLESLSVAGPTALIRPSDPRTAHTRPYVPDPGMSPEERMVLPDELWKRPQYASIGEMWARGEKKLEDVNFLSRHAMPTAMQGGGDNDFLAGDESSMFLDDDDNDNDGTGGDLHIERVLGGEGFNEPSFSGIGAKFRDPRGGWNRQSLSAGPTASADVRRPFENGATLYSKRYAEIKTDTFVYRWMQSNDIANPLLRVAVQALLLSRSTGKQWMRALESNILMPINIVLWRMEITHDMSSMILMKGGLDTGANLYGFSNFSTGNDVASKTVYGHYTVKTKAMVWRERNVVLIEDVKSERYRGGNNAVFIQSPRVMAARRDDVDRPSFIATAIPITEDDLPRVMSFTGTLEIPDLNQSIDRPPMSYSTAGYYNGMVWKLGERVSSGDPGKDYFFDHADRYNVHAMQGLQFLYNRNARNFSRVVDCQGHRGKYGSYPGAAGVWNGDFKFLERQDFQNLGLE